MAHLATTDIVPALRGNLSFNHPPLGLGTGYLNLTNVSSGEELRLRGFEYSLARMLDGRRTAGEVVEAAAQVGLPVTLEDLEGFVKKLSDHQLVTSAKKEPDSGEVSAFERRQSWDEKTRQLYRLALREGRSGNLNRALVSLDCLLHQRPSTTEAIELHQRLEHRRQSPEPAAPFRQIFAETELDWRQPEPDLESAAGRKRLGTIVAGSFFTLGVLAMAASLVPFPHQLVREAMLLPIASAKVSAPRTGTIATVPVEVGQWVEKDTVLYTYEVTEQLRELELAVARLDKLNRALYSYLPQTAEVDAARGRWVKAEAKLAAAQTRLEQEREHDGDRLIEAEDALNWALKEITDAREALDAMVPEEQRRAMRAQRSEVQELELQLLQDEVKAPISGAITMLAVRPGEEVVRGLSAVQLDDGRQLKAVARVEPRDRRALAAGQPVLLLANGRATQTTITSTSGQTVEIVIDNQAGKFEPGVAEVQIRGKPVPLLR